MISGGAWISGKLILNIYPSDCSTPLGAAERMSPAPHAARYKFLLGFWEVNIVMGNEVGGPLAALKILRE